MEATSLLKHEEGSPLEEGRDWLVAGGAVRGRAERRGALELELNPEPGEYAGPLENMGPGRGSLQGLVGKPRGQEEVGSSLQR